MAQPATLADASEQVRLLRAIAERVERGELALSPSLQAELERVLEDELDREAVQAARGEPTVPWDKVKADLGL
jgi:phage terminase small subunit